MTEDQKEKQRQSERGSKARRRALKTKPSRFVNIKSDAKKRYIDLYICKCMFINEEGERREC